MLMGRVKAGVSKRTCLTVGDGLLDLLHLVITLLKLLVVLVGVTRPRVSMSQHSHFPTMMMGQQ